MQKIIMDHLALFNGIGGFQLAASWMGWNNVAHVEIDEWCNSKVVKHFPNSKCYLDIKDFNGKEYEGRIDIITGGFPCQPFSVAGKQKGKGDDRHLWPEMFRVIREVRPPFILGENVLGIIRMELENICLALEGEGYEVQPFIIPSASIGAWDKRERVWIIAHNQKFRIGRLSIQQRGQNKTGNIDINGQIEINSNTESTISEQSRKTRAGRNGCSDSNCINSDINKFNSDHAGYNSITIPQQQKAKVQFNSNTNCKSAQGYSRYETSKRESDQIRRNGQTNWLRDWIEVASELCRSNARVSSELDEVIKIYEYGNKNTNYQETIATIDLFRGEVLRDMWCEKHKIKQTSLKTRPECFNDIMYSMPYQYTHERWNLGQRIKKDKKLCGVWDRILSSSLKETQDMQSEMLERIREIERNEKAGHDRTNRIKALGNSVNPYVVYQIFKAIEQFTKTSSYAKT
jgi:DNA (cytosine-5)-methyltransferase 1